MCVSLVLSLFLGSFDEQAGIATAQKECWEIKTTLLHSIIAKNTQGHKRILSLNQDKLLVSESMNFNQKTS